MHARTHDRTKYEIVSSNTELCRCMCARDLSQQLASSVNLDVNLVSVICGPFLHFDHKPELVGSCYHRE
jgi:hypothetical protein